MGFYSQIKYRGFIAAGAGKLRHLRSALQAETESCIAAIEGAELLGINRAMFESDCQVLVSALKTKSHELSEVGVLMQEARSKCIQEFEVYDFIHCRHECNRVAHALAQYGFRVETECSGWVDEAPPFVSVLVASDIAEHQG